MIFILGGKGFVGSAIARYCSENKLLHQVVTRENYDQFKGQSCDIFINANGNSKKYLAKDHPLAEFDASVRSIRASLTDFIFDYYVHLSSCDVYPDCASPATTHEDIALNITQQSPYGFHKYLGEQCVRHVAKRWLIIRMGGFVGPGLKKNPIFDILQGGPLWLDPKSELQYMHTDVFTKILFNLIDQNIENQIVNVAGEGTVRLEDVIKQVAQDVPVKKDSPLVQYEISIDRLCSMVKVPESYQTVLNFVRAEIQRLKT